MRNSYTIRDLLALLRSKVWFIIIFTAVIGAASFLAAEFIMPPKYESYTTMYVKNQNAVNPETDNNVDINDLNASKSLVSTYIAVLKSNKVMNEVGDRLFDSFEESDLRKFFTVKDGKIDTDQIKACYSMSAVDETEVMKITANTLDPELSAEMCTIIGEIAPEFLIRVVGAGSVEIVDEAVLNYKPVSPNVPLITLIGLIIGFSLSVFVVLLIDFFDDTIKESEQLSKKFNKAILGEIDSLSAEKGRKKKKKTHSNGDRYLLTEKEIPFSVTESFKSIRSNIVFSLGTSDKKVVAISSPNPSEGKSTTAANIAIAFAQTDSSVLLIDADMRKPVQHKTFKVKNDEGLSTLIISKSSIAKSVKSNVANGLDLLPSGPMPPNPSELLSSDQFKQLLEELSQDYDYVIIDTPPVNVVSDAMVMKDSINGILLVLKYGETTYADVTNCMKQIELANASLFGFIVNEVKHTHGGAYYNYKYKYKYKDYSYGYGYGHRPQGDSEESNVD